MLHHDHHGVEERLSYSEVAIGGKSTSTTHACEHSGSRGELKRRRGRGEGKSAKKRTLKVDRCVIGQVLTDGAEVDVTIDEVIQWNVRPHAELLESVDWEQEAGKGEGDGLS